MTSHANNMNTIKQAVSELFGSPMQNMSYVSYFRYVNEAGKITAKSLLELVTICLTYMDEQEKKNAQYEENFKEIEKILQKLVDDKEETAKKIVKDVVNLTETITKDIINERENLDSAKPGMNTILNEPDKALDVKEFEKTTTTNKKSK